MNHQQVDERSRELHGVVAERLREAPELLGVAREILDGWLANGSPRARPALLEWRELLDGDFEELLQFLTATGEMATRLRQSSPFAGEEFIPREVRTAILMEHHDTK